jgi:hypothetical protein
MMPPSAAARMVSMMSLLLALFPLTAIAGLFLVDRVCRGDNLCRLL